jgi:hypothetical protein
MSTAEAALTGAHVPLCSRLRGAEEETNCAAVTAALKDVRRADYLPQLLTTRHDFLAHTARSGVENDFIDLLGIAKARNRLRRVSLEVRRRVEAAHRGMRNLVFAALRARAAKVAATSTIRFPAPGHRAAKEAVRLKCLGAHQRTFHLRIIATAAGKPKMSRNMGSSSVKE